MVDVMHHHRERYNSFSEYHSDTNQPNEARSSRESSPAARRQKRSFTPNSDDGDHVVPAPVQDNADASSPHDTPAPLIRQAVGFSWQPSVLPTANVNTYQAVLPTNPNAIQFLPGQAPPKKKRKRAKPEYSAQTSRFRLVVEPTPASTPEPSMQTPLYAGPGPYSSMYRFTSATPPSASVTMSTPSVADAASPAAEINSPAVASTLASTQRSSYNMTPGAYNNIAAAGPSRSHAQGQAGAPATNTKNKRRKKSTGQRTGSSAQSPVLSAQLQQQPPSAAYYQAVQPSHYRHESNTGSHERSAAPSASAGPVRPLRILTILIEDVRSGVPDNQLAEVRVHLRPGEDPDGGFWVNAKEMCEILQAGPSRIDGPARVYTLRGKYRQFFMRVDADNVLEAESCNLGVSRERTLGVVVEAPPPRGQLPLPPRIPRELQPASSSGSDFAPSPPRQQISRLATYPGPPVDPLSQSDHRTQKRKRHFKSHSSAHHKALRSSLQQETPSPNHTPHRARQSRLADIDSSSSSDEDDGARELSPPVLGCLADTVEERDDAIAKFIQPDIEGDNGWSRCMSIISHGGPKRVSDMLWCCNFVESKVKECEDRNTPPHWDGAPNCWVERRHVWRVLNLTPEWGEECRTVLKLVGYYGKTGRRYQDPLINKEIDSTDPPTEKTWKRFVQLLRTIDTQYNRLKNGGE